MLQKLARIVYAAEPMILDKVVERNNRFTGVLTACDGTCSWNSCPAIAPPPFNVGSFLEQL